MEPNFSISPGAAVGAAVVDQLARTKGWTRLFSVLMWIGAAFLILGGIAMILFGVFAGTMATEMAEQLAAMGGFIGMGVVYFLMAFFYIYPALKLGGYSSRITDLINVPSEANLVAALNEQRAFWKYIGVLTVIMLVLYAVIIVGVLITTGIAAAAAAGSGAS
jgi:hypothetical protein